MSDPPKLSEELLNVGWKVVYSKRKKKWYYFNKKTNMSLWSMPKLGDELSKVEQSSCPALNAAPNAVPGPSNEQAISKKTHPSSHSTQQTENSPAFLSFLQNLTGPSADNRDETTNVPIVNDKAGTLPKSTLDSVSEVINGLKSTSTPPEQREYLLQKGIAMSIELQNTVTLDYGERLEIVNSLIDVVEENSHDPLVNSKNLPPEVEDDVLDEFAVNTLDEMFDQTAEGSKSKIKVLKKQLKTVKALHEKKTPHTDKSFPKMSAGLLNSLQQLHASVLTDIDASKANHGGIHSPEVDKFDSKTKPWMRRVKKSSNHSSEPSHGINVPVLKPPEELSKATSSNASTDPSTPSDSGQKSEQDASEADICSTPSSDVKPSPMDVKSSPADIKASPAEIKASPAESKSSLDCKTSDSLKSPYDEKGSEESDGKKQFDKNSRFNLWTSPESSRRMDPRAHSYRNRGNFLQGTTSSSESPYKGSPVMSQYKIENKPPIKHPKPWHVRPSLFDKIISNKTPANREEETEPKFFSPLSKLDETPTTYGAYKRQFQSAQKEKQQKANNNVMMKPWLDVTNNQHGEQVKSPLYPPLAKKTISAPTLDRKQGSYVEKTVEQMLKSYQNQKEMHNYRIPKRVQRDKKSVEISGAHGTKDDTPHDRHRRVSNTEECDTMSSAPSDYDTMSTCSEMPGKTHPTIDSDTDSQVGGSSVLSDDSTTKTKKNRPVRKLNWGPKSKRINTVEKDQSDPEECTPDSTTSLTTAPQQPMKPLSEMPPLRPLAPALGKPQNQQEQDKKNVYENWMLENKAWIMAKIENLRQNLKQLNSKLETVTQKERDGEMEGPDFKFHLSRLLFDISNATEQIEQYEVIAEKHQKRIKGYITLQKICRQKINPQIKIEGRAPLSWKTAESEKMKEEGAGDNEVSSTTNGTQKEEESSKSDKVMRVINGCEVELDVAEDPFEWMYDDDDLVLQVSRFKVKSEPGQGDDAEETPVLQLGEAEGGGFGTCADIEKVKPEPFADDATIGETDSTMLLNIEQTAAISMEQWQEGIVIKQEPTEDQLPIISAQTLSMEQWESGDVPSVSEEESSGLQLVATTAEPMSLEQWNATEDESSKTEDKPQILEAEAISVEKFEESKDETLKNAEDGKIVEPAKDTVKLSSPKLSEQTTKTESEPTKDDDCFPGASDVDMRMDYHPESLLSNLGYSGNAKDYSFNRIEKTKISLPMSDPALLHVHNCYLTVEDHLNKKNIPSAYTHLRQNNWPCPPLGCSNEIQYRTFRVRLLRRMMWDILMLTKSSSNESIASKTYHLTIAADVLKKVLVTRKRDLEIAGHEAAIMNLNQIFEAVVDRLTMVKQNQLSYRLFTYIQSFPSLQLTLSLGVLHRLIEAMYNEKSLDMDVLQNLFTTVSDRGLYPPQVSTPSVTQLRTIILLRQFNQADIFLVIHHYFKEMFKSLITHVHKGAPLPITAYQVSVCMVDNSTMSHQMRDVFRETMDKKKIFITLSKVLEQLKPSIAIYPSQDAVYKLDSDNVRSHLFMQALREVGARILEPHRHGQDYTVKQARVLFGSVLMAEPTPPAQPAQPIPKSPIKIQNISGVKTVIQSSPSAIPVVNIAGIVKLDTKQFKGDVKNEIKKEQSTQPPIDDSKPSISSLLAAEEVLNMRSSALNEPRPEPIDPYNVNEPEVTKHTKRPRRGNHTFSYRSGRHPDNKHSYRPDDYEDSDGNIYLSSPDSIHSDIFHIPYNIKYQMEEYDGCEDGYFQGREILMIQEAINATRHETTIHYDYEQDDDQDSYDARHYQGLYDHEERPSERGNYESMEYEGMEYDRPNMAYAAMKYDDDQRRYDSSSRYEDPAYDVYRDNDMRTSTLEPTEAVYGRPRRMHPLEDRKRKAPLLPTIPAKRKPPYM